MRTGSGDPAACVDDVGVESNDMRTGSGVDVDGVGPIVTRSIPDSG
jgi:hypothetical protein